VPSEGVDRRAPSFGSIVHVNEKGGSFGGTEEYLALLTAELADHGVESHLVCGALTGAVPDAMRSVHVIEGLASRAASPGTASVVADFVAAIGADVVYVHNVFDPRIVAALVARPGRGAVIWYVHDHYLTCLTELRWRRDIGPCTVRLGAGCLEAIGDGHCVRRFADRVLDRAGLDERLELADALQQVDAVVVVSDYMRDILSAAAPEAAGRIHCLPRPIRAFGERQEPERTGPDDPAVVLVAGRITAEKGLAVVLTALADLSPGGPVDVRIAGVVEDTEYWAHCLGLADAARLANGRVTVTPLGHLQYGAIDDELGRADIVAVPSQWPEPFGAVALEAMAAGAAVVASRVGGLAKMVVDGRNGLLVDPSDIAGWTAALDTLLGDPARARRLGTQAHRDVLGASIDEHVTSLDRIVASLVRR